jgi:hypothetical protein
LNGFHDEFLGIDLLYINCTKKLLNLIADFLGLPRVFPTLLMLMVVIKGKRPSKKDKLRAAGLR